MTILGLYTRKKRTQHYLIMFSCECIEKTTKNTPKRMQLTFNENERHVHMTSRNNTALKRKT